MCDSAAVLSIVRHRPQGLLQRFTPIQDIVDDVHDKP